VRGGVIGLLTVAVAAGVIGRDGVEPGVTGRPLVVSAAGVCGRVRAVDEPGVIGLVSFCSCGTGVGPLVVVVVVSAAVVDGVLGLLPPVDGVCPFDLLVVGVGPFPFPRLAVSPFGRGVVPRVGLLGLLSSMLTGVTFIVCVTVVGVGLGFLLLTFPGTTTSGVFE